MNIIGLIESDSILLGSLLLPRRAFLGFGWNFGRDDGVVGFEDGVELGPKFGCFLRSGSEEVLGFTDVVLQVVEFLAAIGVEAEEFPVAIADDATRSGSSESRQTNDFNPPTFPPLCPLCLRG